MTQYFVHSYELFSNEHCELYWFQMRNFVRKLSPAVSEPRPKSNRIATTGLPAFFLKIIDLIQGKHANSIAKSEEDIQRGNEFSKYIKFCNKFILTKTRK